MFHALSFKNIFFIEIVIVCLISHSSLSDALQERHYVHYMVTAMTQADSFNFSSLGLCDDGQISHNCNKVDAWIKTIPNEVYTGSDDYRDWYKYELKKLSNCTGSRCSEIYVLQRIIGCELEKLPDGTVTNLTVFNDYGFNGEDFISFNSDTMQWIEKNPKAKEIKEQWDRHGSYNKILHNCLKTCVNLISAFNNTKKSSPDVHFIVRKSPDDDDSKLVLICLATGFFPRDVQMNIRLNRTNLENQTSSGIRPNDDETFQKRISVKIHRDHEGSYDCQVTHSSLTEPVTVNWDGTCFDCETHYSWKVKAGVAVAVAVLVLFVPLIVKMKRRNGWARRSSSYGAVNDQTEMASPDDVIHHELNTGGSTHTGT